MELLTIKRSGPSCTIRDDRQHGAVAHVPGSKYLLELSCSVLADDNGFWAHRRRVDRSPRHSPSRTVPPFYKSHGAYNGAGRERGGELHSSRLSTFLEYGTCQFVCHEQLLLRHRPEEALFSRTASFRWAFEGWEHHLLYNTWSCFYPLQVGLQAHHQPPHLRPRRPPFLHSCGLNSCRLRIKV